LIISLEKPTEPLPAKKGTVNKKAVYVLGLKL